MQQAGPLYNCSLSNDLALAPEQFWVGSELLCMFILIKSALKSMTNLKDARNMRLSMIPF